MRWRRACASTTSATRERLVEGRRHRGRLLPAVRLSRAKPGPTSKRRCSWSRELEPDDIGVSVSYPLPGHAASTNACAQELGPSRTGSTRRPRDDVQGDLRARVLPPRASTRASRVPRAQVGSGAGGRRARAVGSPAIRRPPRRVVALQHAPPLPWRESKCSDSGKNRRDEAACRPLQPARGVLHDAAGAGRAGVGARSSRKSTSSSSTAGSKPIRFERWSTAAAGAVCVGITVLTGAPIHDALAVSRAVKAARSSCPIVWGGWHPSLFAAECLDEPSVDMVVSGQGEDAFRDIVDRLIDRRRRRTAHQRERPLKRSQRISSARLFADPGRAVSSR